VLVIPRRELDRRRRPLRAASAELYYGPELESALTAFLAQTAVVTYSA